MTFTLSPEAPMLFILMFTRIGILVMLFPTLGEHGVPTRVRLLVALTLTLILFPVHRGAYGVNLASPTVLFPALFVEAVIGFIFGLAARMATSAIQVAGNVIATTLGMSFAMQMDPTQNSQGAVIGTFLALVAAEMMFATDMHHLALSAISGSFSAMKPGELVASGDVAQFILKTVAEAFKVGVQLSAPFVVFSLVFSAGLGVMARLMPQMQVFYIATPLQVGVGMFLLVGLIGVMMPIYLAHVAALLRDLGTLR